MAFMDDASSAGAKEFEESQAPGAMGESGGVQEAVVPGGVGSEDSAIEAMEFLTFLKGQPGATQSDHIEATDAVVAPGDAAGGEIEGNGGAALHEGEGADADKLVDEAIAGDESPVVHGHKAGEEGAIGDDDPVSDTAIVAEMTMGHEQVVGADPGGVVISIGAMDGDMFAEGIVVADIDPGEAAMKAEVLGGAADDAAGGEHVTGAGGGGPGEVDMRADLTVFAEGNVGVDDGVGPHDHAGVQTGAGIDHGRGMNGHGELCPTDRVGAKPDARKWPQAIPTTNRAPASPNIRFI